MSDETTDAILGDAVAASLENRRGSGAGFSAGKDETNQRR